MRRSKRDSRQTKLIPTTMHIVHNPGRFTITAITNILFTRHNLHQTTRAVFAKMWHTIRNPKRINRIKVLNRLSTDPKPTVRLVSQRTPPSDVLSITLTHICQDLGSPSKTSQRWLQQAWTTSPLWLPLMRNTFTPTWTPSPEFNSTFQITPSSSTISQKESWMSTSRK